MAKRQWRYFDESEINGLHYDLVDMLDRARHLAGTAFRITSGKREKNKNAAVGGVENSAHESGLAADIEALSSPQKFKILHACLAVGFNRIGVYRTHIHVDIDTSKPQHVVWYGEKPPKEKAA